MKRQMKLLLVTLVFGVGAFAFSASMSARVAQADAQCNCIVYTCPWHPELQCKGHIYAWGCDYLDLNCECPPCP
jgi:hypothetical protein